MTKKYFSHIKGLMLSFEDQELAQRVKEKNDQEALLELIDRHSGIYVHMIKCYGSKSLSKDQISDLLDEKDYNIYKAALDFDHSKSKFSTYLANKTKYICLTERTLNKKRKKIVSYEGVDFCQASEEASPDSECLFNEGYKRMINMILRHSDDRVQTIFYERYFCGEKGKLTPWKSISEKVGLSTQGCINIHNRTLLEFKNKIKNEKIKL